MGTRCVCRARKRGDSRARWAFALALRVCLATASGSWAADPNTPESASSNSSDVIKDSPNQANTNSWRAMADAATGSGNQTLDVSGNTNTGSGSQTNGEAATRNWRNITNANAGSGAQVINSVNSNGRDRKSGRLRSGREDWVPAGSEGPSGPMNAGDWSEIDGSLVGTGNQARAVGGSANTGSGSQTDSNVEANNWSDVVNANAGSGGQVTKSTGSSGRDRESDSLEIGTFDESSMLVSQSVLESSVSRNAVAVAGRESSSDSSFAMRDNSQVSGLLGMNAIAIATGANMSQNVNVSMLGILSTEPALQSANAVAPLPAAPLAAPVVSP